MSEMSPAEEVFFAALERPSPADRAAYLDAACAGQPELRARVEKLLAAHPRVGEFLKSGTPDHATRSFGDPAATGSFRSAPTAEESEGTVIAGRYKLRQQIGEGGMGTVWLAEQTEPVKRKVAVKLIRVERGQSKTILARFEAERQAIALMDHPHIAKLLDAGTSETGAPFFVMELVKGVPLTEFCDQHKLTIAERLNLFTQICSAVQHAHQKGVIHRDLKPGNILVESHDGKPVPKVIDFGLAKATTGLQLTDQSMFTAFGSVMGTPLYMAPEQASFNAVDVDTRADVYALGVILYELLTGTTPLTKEALKRAALDEMLRLVREQEAPMPSSRLSSADSTPSVAASRQIEPAKLGRFVKGELDWIVLKALSKDRDRRYETANGFAKDIERFLNHEPVQAGPVGTAYKLRKFVRRNRVQVIAASLVLLALVAGVVGTTLGLLEARRSAERERLAKIDAEQKKTEAEKAAQAETIAKEAEAEAKRVADKKRQEAETNLAFAKKGNDILGSVFAGLDPKRNYANVGEFSDTLKANLRKAVKELEGSAIGDPLEVAAMQVILGESLLGLGEAKLAVEVLEKARDTLKARRGPEHPLTLASMHNLAEGYRDDGQSDKALPLFVETFQGRKSTLGPDHPDTLKSMGDLALGYSVAGLKNKAMPLYEEARKLAEAKLGPDHVVTLHSMNNLANGYQSAGQLDKALRLREETLKRSKAKLGPDHPDTLHRMNMLAVGFNTLRQWDKAVEIWEETFQLTKAKLGPDHPDTLNSMNNLAIGYKDAGQRDKALQVFEEALKLSKVRLGPDHPHTLNSMANLALGYEGAKKPELALPLLEERFFLSKAKHGPDHADTLESLGRLADGYWAVGQREKSLPLFEEMLKRLKNKFGPDHPETLAITNILAPRYRTTGQAEKAVPLYEEMLEFAKAKHGLDHPETLNRLGNLGKAYCDTKQGKKAADTLAAFVTGMKKQLPPDGPQVAGLLLQISTDLLACDQFATAEEMLRESLTIRERAKSDTWTTFNTMSVLGAALLGQKKYADAEPLLVKGYEGMKAREKTISPKVIGTPIPKSLDRLIELYTATNKPDEVKKYRDLRAEYPTPKEVAPMPREKK